jgi:hypothetical protein
MTTFKGLEALQDASEYFIQDELFNRQLMPDQSQYLNFIKYLGPHGGNYGDEDHTSYALSGYLFDADEVAVNGMLDLVSEHGLARYENAALSGKIPSVLFHLPVAVARTCRLGIPPDASTISEGLKLVLTYFENQKKKSISHVSDVKTLIDSTYAGFLAQDLEAVEKLLFIRKNHREYPYMDQLARDMLVYSKQLEIDGHKILRIQNIETQSAFVSLFDAHRDWTRKMFMKKFPSDYNCFLGIPFIGSYCLAWIYLQSFAPEPIFHISKADMRLILTDTQV